MKGQTKLTVFLSVCLLLAGCSATRRLKPGQYLYTGAEVLINPDSSGRITDKNQVKKTLESKTRPRPNKSFLGFKYKLFLYNLAADTVKPKGLGNWLKNKVGERPVLMSDVKIKYNNDVLKSYLISQGYLQAEASGDTVLKTKTGKAIYTVNTGIRYKINSITFPKDTGTLTNIINQNKEKTLLKVGDYYDLDTYKNERIRIDNDLKESGYFYFSPDHLIIRVDSTIGKNLVDIRVNIKNIAPDAALKPYTIKNINIYPNYTLRRDSILRSLKPLEYNDFRIYDNRNTFKPKLFDRLVFFKKGENYNRRDHNQSLNRLVNVGAFQDVRAEFLPIDSFKNNQLDLNIFLTPLKKNSLTFSVTGTNKSNGYIGSEVKVTQTTRNLFRGAEQLDVSVGAGTETQVSGRGNVASYSLSAEGKLTFPQFIIPFYKPKSTTAFIPKTVASLSAQLLGRDTVYKLVSFKAELGYNWKESARKEHNLNPISVNLVQPTEHDSAALAALKLKIPGLENTLEEQFIIGSNYNFTYSNQLEDRRKNTTYFFGGLETGGNLWGAFVSKNENGKKMLFGVPLTQFIRLETDLRNYHKINTSGLVWANRLNFGYGYAYGNSASLPFVRQFFAGGSNDIRAFRARSLGPGTYEVDQTQTFADQGGDIKLMLNSELRFKIAGPLHGALFVDAGNIWLRKEDLGEPGIPNSARPGSKFRLRNALNELAVGTGAGLRIDAAIFVIRLDGAFPIRKPYLPNGERWVIHKVDFGSKTWRKENFILNIGIGYPF
ncbi:MAG: BamA/TamA family outer membrane protein [Pedobacter sp.]|jgi:outer membrane protein assembly factor BamA|uniref:translocation and assembly module lipoprotein TamL n=1 Tax=Pedobacter sp. TaxID=1411316 RepID=UPI0035640A1A